jgi:hypothetical protein
LLKLRNEFGSTALYALHDCVDCGNKLLATSRSARSNKVDGLVATIALSVWLAAGKNSDSAGGEFMPFLVDVDREHSLYDVDLFVSLWVIAEMSGTVASEREC